MFVNIIYKDDYYLDYKIDAERVYKFILNKNTTNAHDVNPIYIKKIGVEIDKKSN